MNVRLILLACLLTCAFVSGGCDQGQISGQDAKTLEGNLTKPVDVEKIRAEYKAQQESGKAGAAVGGGGAGNQ
jgi:hypothetical protein